MKIFTRVFLFLTSLLITSNFALAQWEVQNSHTNAGLRGIHAVNRNVAWASGTQGTILRTVDGGKHWQNCATPPGGETLDFRGVWAWSAERAEVMSAGLGDQSRVYQTTDACQHWTEVARNTEKDGFWDSFAHRKPGNAAVLIGDPVRGRFDIWQKVAGKWVPVAPGCEARPGESAFAASNSLLTLLDGGEFLFVTGGKGGPRALRASLSSTGKPCEEVRLPLASGNESSGAFSVALRDQSHGVVVGGDYKKPDETGGTAAFTVDGGRHWTAASRPPHGYRSSVAWDESNRIWISAGTNGSDLSSDDGKTWRSLDKGNWNALSLPYAVGPNGKIGKLIRPIFKGPNSR